MKKYLYSGLIIVIIITIDYFTKLYALKYFHITYKVTDFLSFILVMNKGISFGILNNESQNQLLLIVIGFMICLILLIYVDKKYFYAKIVIISGAIANIIDRILYHGVVDFIYFHFKEYGFPAFNIADSCIVMGVTYIVITDLYIKKTISI